MHALYWLFLLCSFLSCKMLSPEYSSYHEATPGPGPRPLLLAIILALYPIMLAWMKNFEQILVKIGLSISIFHELLDFLCIPMFCVACAPGASTPVVWVWSPHTTFSSPGSLPSCCAVWSVLLAFFYSLYTQSPHPRSWDSINRER